ncbi:MAG: phage tail tube protein [Pseudomonadota bacterium]
MALVSKNGVSKLERSTDNTTFTNIPGVKSFSAGDIQAEQLDVTDYDSPGGQREYVNGLLDANDGSFVINFDPADTVHQALQADAGGASIYLRHQFGTRQVTMLVNVISFSTPVEVGGVHEATVTIRPAQAAVWSDVS